MFTIKGHIKQLMDEQTGTSKAGREWTSREFVLEVNDEGFVYTVPFKAFGRDVDSLKDCQVGDALAVDFRPGGREYGGKWYTDIVIRGIHAEHKAPAPAAVTGTQTDLPF